MTFRKIGIVLLIALLAWLGLIFTMSSQTAVASGEMSQSVTKEFIVTGEKVGMIEKGTAQSPKAVEQLDSAVRKLAHMGMYFVLAGIIFSILWAWGMERFKAALISLVGCIAVSIMDEINQMQFAGRNSGGVISEGIGDLVRDAGGAITALVIFVILRSITVKRLEYSRFRKAR